MSGSLLMFSNGRMASVVLSSGCFCESCVILGLAGIDGVVLEGALVVAISSETLPPRPSQMAARTTTTDTTPTPIQNSPRLVGADIAEPEDVDDGIEDKGEGIEAGADKDSEKSLPESTSFRSARNSLRMSFADWNRSSGFFSRQ